MYIYIYVYRFIVYSYVNQPMSTKLMSPASQDPLELHDQRPGERSSEAPRPVRGLGGDGRCGDPGSGSTGTGTRRGTTGAEDGASHEGRQGRLQFIISTSDEYQFIQHYINNNRMMFGNGVFYFITSLHHMFMK